ncbi:unnamed protein product [Musa acuminata subsp. malaccensis]|uniref:(wild Malaysian banana) hypothetical protein n=1 Tax=Musa acuminata subsp. malaccensis TaxID=214687 RepID=A0A804I7E0_MUSAM|nr:unnamed protein product [Musa acuminata subsp. malaccensis]
MNFLRMAAVPVLERLHLEERLLRTSADNWCIVNDGTIHLAIVMAYGSLWIVFGAIKRRLTISMKL